MPLPAPVSTSVVNGIARLMIDNPPVNAISQAVREGVMRAEGEAVLAEGMAESAADIDVVMITGYGLPRLKGGPMFSI
jgi:enoyl-CoA hydratase/carnithine racemase